MTRLAASLLALLLLGACSMAEKTMPDAQCRQAAYDDPQVRIERARNAGFAAFGQTTEARDALLSVQKDAYTRCMRQRGLAPLGGVEAVRPAR